MKASINRDYTYYRLSLVRSRIQGRGVVADEDIPANRPVIEHTGRLMNRRDFARTEAARDKRRHEYVWYINSHWSMDGSIGGSGAQYVNHSCMPNCAARFVGKRIYYYYSKRAIKKGEELTIDYNFDWCADPLPCRCGTKLCRGTVNRRDKVKRKK